MKRPDRDTIRRVLDERATPQEAREVARWFSSAEGAAELSRLIDEEARMLETGERMPASGIPSEAIYRRIRAALVRRRRRRIALRVAAVLIPCLLVLGVGIRLDRQVGGIFSAPEYAEIYVPKGERMQMVFQDGTRVWLNADTRLRYSEKFGFSMRRVELDGEAYFSVSHNPARPFVVGLGGAQIEVLGTEFNVQAYDDSPLIAVSLDAGSVSMSDGRNSFLLAPSDRLLYDRTTRQGRLDHVDTSGASLWRKSIISFRDTPLEEVLRTLGRWYDVTFRVTDPRAYDYYFTLTTHDSSLREILSELQRIAPMRFTREGDTIVIGM